MKTVSGTLTAHLQQEVTTLAVLWKVERSDGVVMSFTDHDEDVFYENLTFKARTGFLRSAIANSATLASDELEVQGFVDDESITAQDLRVGKFDYALVTIMMVNYADLSMGHMFLRYGRFGEVTQTPSGRFNIELRGLVQQLSQQVGEVYSPDCRVDLFSPKCKLKAIPDQRIAGAVYDVGARVVVRDDLEDKTYNLPLVNPGFRNTSYSTLSAWLLENATAGEILTLYTRGVTTRDWICRVSQTIDLDEIRGVGLNDTSAVFSIRQLANSSFQMSRLTVTALGTADAVLGLFALDYAKIPTSATVLSLSTGFLPSGTLKIKIEVQTRKRNTPTFLADEPFEDAYSSYLYDFSLSLSGVGYASGNIVQDPNFTTGDAATSTILGWTNNLTLNGFAAYTQLYGFFGRDGGSFALSLIALTSPVYLTSTRVSLTGGPITTGDIDAGNFVLDLSWWQANIDINGAADATIVFYGPSLPSIGVAGNYSPKEINPAHEWQQKKKIITVPVGAREVAIRIRVQPSRNNFSGRPLAAVTDFLVDMRHKDAMTYDFAVFGGVEYIAMVNGITASTSALGWSRTLGAMIFDGGMIWSVVKPMWSDLGVITEVTSRGKFKVASIDRPDDWFRWGLVKILSGDASGYTVECVRWDNTTKQMELALPLPYLPEVGDQVWLQVGCDKSIKVCAAKFSNGINFRGEPYIPGTDQYFRIGSPVGGSR